VSRKLKGKSTVRVYLTRSKTVFTQRQKYKTLIDVYPGCMHVGKRKRIRTRWKRSPGATIHRCRRVFMRNKSTALYKDCKICVWDSGLRGIGSTYTWYYYYYYYYYYYITIIVPVQLNHCWEGPTTVIDARRDFPRLCEKQTGSVTECRQPAAGPLTKEW